MNAPADVFLSIVIPTYRRAERLGALLSALDPQVASSAEIIEVVVVDNCPDGSAQASVLAAPGHPRYFHEPNPGVARARNRGLAEAEGRFVLFIDDDQLPDAGWLAAFEKAARDGQTAVFGPVRPSFEVAPSLDLRAQLVGLFTRDFNLSDGSDISARRAYLGTGNSMFHRARCFLRPEPFDLRFDGGGEDVWLLRELVQDLHLKLTWCAGAGVEEVVPASRMTAAYVRARKFRNGQLRCIVEAGGGNWPAVAFWMAVGVTQAVGYGLAAGFAAVLRPVLKSDRGSDLVIRAASGLGKVLWWQKG